MNPLFNKGFTLIELLVVIAIIGILATIVLVSLGNARQKAADSGIQGNLNTVRTQMEVYASNNGNTYGTALATTTAAANTNACISAANGFASDPVYQALFNARSASGGNIVCALSSSPSFWAVAVQLKTDTSLAWCVSSTGVAKQISYSTTMLNAGAGCL